MTEIANPWVCTITEPHEPHVLGETSPGQTLTCPGREQIVYVEQEVPRGNEGGPAGVRPVRGQ